MNFLISTPKSSREPAARTPALRSVGVLACEFWRRPAARLSAIFNCGAVTLAALVLISCSTGYYPLATPPSKAAAAQPSPAAPPPAHSTTPPPKVAADQPTIPPPPSPTNLETARKTLLGADLAFSRICEEQGSPEGFYQCMSSNAICLMAGALPIEGRDAIKIHLAAGPQGTLSWKPKDAEIGAGADLGYTWGTYQFRGTNPEGKPQTTHGKYVIIWKKQPDGAWKANLYASSRSPVPPIPR